MSSPSSRWRIELATPDDAAALAAIYNSDDGFGGEIQVKFTREPDPYASLLAEGSGVVIPVVREVDTGRLVGMGACVVHEAYVDGKPVKVGYLTGLKALPEYRRGVPLIPQVYAFLREQTPEVRCYYTTILSANTLARKLLEKPRPRMPEYRPVAEYVTHFYRVPPFAGRLRGSVAVPEVRACEPRRAVPEVRPSRLGFASHLRDRTAGLPAELAAVTPLPGAEPWQITGRDGTPEAWCQVLDQRATKQYVVTAYTGRYERLAKLPVHWLGYPRLPQVGVPANHVSLAGIGARDDDPATLLRLLRGVGAAHRDRDFIMVGVAGDQPLTHALARLRTITYSSQLYTVHFDDDCLPLGPGRIGLDVGLL